MVPAGAGADKGAAGLQWLPSEAHLAPAGAQSPHAVHWTCPLCWELARDKGCMRCRRELVPRDKRLLTCTVQKAASRGTRP